MGTYFCTTHRSDAFVCCRNMFQSAFICLYLLIVHFLWVWSCGQHFGLSALSEFRPLPELRVHLEGVDLLCCLLNKTRNTEKDKKIIIKQPFTNDMGLQSNNQRGKQNYKHVHMTNDCVWVWRLEMKPATWVYTDEKYRLKKTICGSSVERGSKLFKSTGALE